MYFFILYKTFFYILIFIAASSDDIWRYKYFSSVNGKRSYCKQNWQFISRTDNFYKWKINTSKIVIVNYSLTYLNSGVIFKN